jgi:hypothetical protein
MKPVLKQLHHEAKRGLFAVDSCQQLSNTVRANSRSRIGYKKVLPALM